MSIIPIHGTVIEDLAQSFTFTLDSANILNTRSAHTDTDYASFSIRITPQTGQAISMSETLKLGDLADGLHPINLSFPNVKVSPTDKVIVTYLIVNSGHSDPTKVQSTMKSATDQLSLTGTIVHNLEDFNALTVTLTVMKTITSLLSSVFSSIFGSGPNCDGTVAAMQEGVTWADLQAAGTSAMTRTATHPGSDSPHGCGKNSVYEVTWHAKKNPVNIVAAK